MRHLRLSLPRSRLVLLALLPRGTRSPTYDYKWPSNFTAGIAAVNKGMKKVAGAYPGVSFLDCGAPYLSGGSKAAWGGRIVEDFMPDTLHPSMKGMDLLAECLDPVLARIITPGAKS